jgi:hypothetical protein
MRRYLVPLALAAIGASLGSCSGNQPQTTVDANAPATLTVDNQAFNDMDIYVLAEGQRVRLGQVTGHQQAKLTIPNTLLRGTASLRFVADPIGGTHAPVSQQIIVNPGDEVVLRIPPT